MLRLPTDLQFSVPANNPISVIKTNQEILFKFEWFGSLGIDPDMGLMFSVCDKANHKPSFKCSDPEPMTPNPYQIELSYARKRNLAINVAILGLDIDGEPILSSGIHSFHCMLSPTS